MQDLRITLLQTELHWQAPEANRLAFEGMIYAMAPQTDLIVLPEMFTTGFSMASREHAEPWEGDTLAWMQQLATQTGVALTGSFMVEDGGQYTNRLAFVLPDGAVSHYDKRHLFAMAGEHEHYRPGLSRLIVEYRGWRICPLICYDLRFPVWSRNQDDYDLLLYVANWPVARRYAWTQLLIARAIENQAYVAGVNRVGTDGNGVSYSGFSSVIDPMGQVLFEQPDTEVMHTETLSWEQLQAVRDKLPFLRDRDQFTIHP